MLKQPVIKYDDTPCQRILVIADIHGGYQAFSALLTELQPGPDDLLVTLGDCIDRGPDSCAVMAELRQCATTLNTVHLRGNHEGMLLMAMSRSPTMPDMYDDSIPDNSASLAASINMWLSNGGLQTLESYCCGAGKAAADNLAGLKKAMRDVCWPGSDKLAHEDALIGYCNDLIQIIPAEDYAFLRTRCVDALATKRHILVHGGYDPKQTLQGQTLATLHWAYPADNCTTLPRTLVVGHQIMRKRLPKLIGSLLYLDTGSSCVTDGRLTCMDILNQEFWQADQSGHICHHGQLT